MSDRITSSRVTTVLNHYAQCLVSTGVCTPDQVRGICMASPYGQMRYVCRYVDHYPLHDVPGFVGSNVGYATMRELYDAVQQSKRTLFESLDAHSVAHRLGMPTDYPPRVAAPESVTA